MRIIIIGQGNVACNLQAAFLRAGLEVPTCSSREGLDQIADNADVYIYAVADHALAEVISKVHVQPRALHLHTSGSIPLTVFGEDKPHAGILYPFQSFSKAHILEDFSAVPIFIEARGIDDISALYSVAQLLSPRIYEVTQAEREKLHVAGVFVNNFPNLMYGIAENILRDTSIPFKVLLPLIDETAAKVHSLSPKDAQTGPARRGDEKVMQHHLQVLQNENAKEVYQLLSRFINEQYH